MNRTTKRILRFLPRKAVLHKYPLIGRFAGQLRLRAYLWSVRREQMRPAYYAGSIISFLPLMGIQLPVALVASLVLRCNFMVLGGLQLITNPLTAAPIYVATHQLGAIILERVAPEERPTHPIRHEEVLTAGEYVSGALGDPLAIDETAKKPRWTTRIRHALGALTVGGAVVGFAVGAVLDFSDWVLRRRTVRSRLGVAPGSGGTG